MSFRPYLGPTGDGAASPAVKWTIRPTPDDCFRFYHVDATAGDIHSLWALGNSCQPTLFTALVWYGDHIIVRPNLLYVLEGAENPYQRYERILEVMDRYYTAQQWMDTLELPEDKDDKKQLPG